MKALEASIDQSLADVFGHKTVQYNHYRGAAKLDHGPIVASVEPDWIAACSGGLGRSFENLDEVHRYLTEGNQQAILLLQQAVRSLEEEIGDRSHLTAAAPDIAEVLVPQDLSKVFVVHGHDGEVRESVARFISEKLSLQPIILHERPNKGRTIIKKFQEESAGAGFAVVLMTPDDFGKARDAADLNPRARQNVVFELGFFIGALGPANVAALVEGDIELPSDFDGVVYISLEKEDWRTKLGQELEAAGYAIDWNKVMRK